MRSSIRPTGSARFAPGLRLLLALLYTSPLTLPVAAQLVHAADHSITEARRDLAWGLPGVEAVDPDEIHVHEHGGTVHAHTGTGHRFAVESLLAAADAMGDGEERSPTTLTMLRLTAHLPPADAFLSAPELFYDPATSTDLIANVSRPTAPPTPPPRIDT